jgi:hypothetical protein
MKPLFEGLVYNGPGVSPLIAPSELVFYLRYRYQSEYQIDRWEDEGGSCL